MLTCNFRFLQARMPNYSDLILTLAKNPVDVFDETTRLLVKIADNVLRDPASKKVRTLQKSNSIISRRIVNVPGAVDCLKFMGFEELGDTLTLPLSNDLDNLQLMSNELKRIKDGRVSKESPEPSTSKETVHETKSSLNEIPEYMQSEITFLGSIKKVELPAMVPISSNSFLRRVERYFHIALHFDNEYLKERARSCVPVVALQLKAQERFRGIQKLIKEGQMQDPQIDIEDVLILELLAWFKNDFFEWVDSPDCSNCGGKTKFSHMSSDKSVFVYTDRVEVHVCEGCRQKMLFPRYDDLNILLETRKGRCGEWAKTFTLICRALGWDARFIVDETDHVWTEVYSHSQKRWVHCDPCENAYDTPLIYESGWNKQVSYVMAYAADDLQDVTWRYTSHHKLALSKRKNCTEQELIEEIILLRKRREATMTESRREYLQKRLLSELIEFMTERKPTDKDQAGRISGSMDWKLSRSETKLGGGFVWKLSSGGAAADEAIVQYSCAKDCYEMLSKGKVIKTLDGWSNGCFASNGIFRKEEKDWKMVYLCRNEGASEGSLCWKFEAEDENLLLHSVKIDFGHELYESGNVECSLRSSNLSGPINISEGGAVHLLGANAVTLVAVLTGGKGAVSWQHAQLFRQSGSSDDFPMKFTFTFRENKSK